MLRKYFPRFRLKETTGRFGIEIETEAESSAGYEKYLPFSQEMNPETSEAEFLFKGLPEWKGVKDNSLRNFGIEFVLRKPLGFNETMDALNKWGQATSKLGLLEDQPGTSVHVHVNVSDFCLRELGNFLFLWVLTEETFVRYCKEYRSSNLFALPCRSAESTVNQIVKMFINLEAGQDGAFQQPINSTKYAGLNLACLCTLGSLEVRLLEGTTDPARIKTWVKMINRVYKISREFHTPATLLERYRKDPMVLLSDIFFHAPHLVGEDALAESRDNLWYAASIVDSVSDWHELDNIFPVSPARRKRERITTASFME